MEIKNTTKQAVKVLLPQGKKLFLGPHATGQIAPKALDHPPLIELIENGTIEVLEGKGGRSAGSTNHPKGISSSQSGHGGGGGPRRSGDR